MGRPTTDFFAPIDYVVRHGDRVPVSIMDRVEETMRMGAFLHDVAARIGFPVEQLREWRKIGMRAARDLAQGRRRHADLTPHERQCGELAIRMERAESEGRLRLLGLGHGLANGGMKRTEVTVKTIGGALVETTTREITAAPDGRMITWLLEHRWPEDFGRRRVELSGPEGGPVPIEVSSAADKLLREIEKAEQANADTAEVDALLAGKTNGNGNGHHA